MDKKDAQKLEEMLWTDNPNHYNFRTYGRDRGVFAPRKTIRTGFPDIQRAA
jgi:hypothetical protein